MGNTKNDFSVVYAVEKLFYKKLPFEEGYEVWASSPAGEMSMQNTNEDFPPRVAEKIGRKNFAEHIGAKEEKARYTKELEPYLEEFKRAAEKKSAAHWKKIEAVAKIPKVVPADIKDFETVFAYLEKEGVSLGDRVLCNCTL